MPPSSLKCLQKSNPGIHLRCVRCFMCFGCFRCFKFAFGPQNRPILVQIRTKPTNRQDRPPAISWQRKTPKKAILPLVYENDTAPCAIGAVFFRRSRLFIHFHTSKPHHPSRPHQIKQPLSKISVNERAIPTTLKTLKIFPFYPLFSQIFL